MAAMGQNGYGKLGVFVGLLGLLVVLLVSFALFARCLLGLLESSRVVNW